MEMYTCVEIPHGPRCDKYYTDRMQQKLAIHFNFRTRVSMV